MRRMVLPFAVFALFLCQPLSAQQWSAEEQGVLDDLAECWDIWMDGIRDGTPDRWITECSTPNSTYWGAQDGAPVNNDFIRRTWGTISGQDLGWVDIRPVALSISDDIAVLHFYGYWQAPGPDGATITEAKRTEVFRQLDGRWKLISGHGTPVTPEDAAPYRRGEG